MGTMEAIKINKRAIYKSYDKSQLAQRSKLFFLII